NYSGTVTFTQVPTGIILPPDNPLEIALGLPTATPLPLDGLLATQFLTGGPLGNQDVKTTITMPDQAVVGVTVTPTDDLQVMADLQWMHWALFNTLPITFTNTATPNEVLVAQYQNSWTGRFGVDYAAGGGWDLRAGYLRQSAAAPAQTVTPLLPEGLRNEFTGGIGYQLTPQLHADVAYQYVRQQNRRGRVINPPSGVAPTTALNSGLYKFHASLVAITLTARF
ncbi:MAG TPA: outer membrane protein transport protein, partial [Gemmatimonadales bacterium]|nr:outer membrane protein transport protein [Gemmatimonadales bacterium]